MKILQLASGDLWAGAEVQLYHLACALSRVDGVALQVVLLNHGQLESMLIEQGISVTVFDENKLSTFQIFTAVKTLSKKYQIDLIHSHRLKENFIGGMVAKTTGCKSIRTAHGDNEISISFWDFRHKLINAMDWFAARYLQSRIVSVSDELKNTLSTIYKPNKIVVINNSVDIKFILNRSLEDFDTEINEENINIGFVGRFVPVKQVGLFYQITKNVINNNPATNIHFYLIGDGPLFGDIKNQIITDGLENKIHLPGFVENSAPYLKLLDYLMFTSEHEGLPMTLLEAMTLQTPVISVELPSIRKVLRGEEAGYFINGNDVSKATLSISKIILDKELAKQKSKKAFEIVNSDYSIENNITKYIQLYKNILSK